MTAYLSSAALTGRSSMGVGQHQEVQTGNAISDQLSGVIFRQNTPPASVNDAFIAPDSPPVIVGSTLVDTNTLTFSKPTGTQTGDLMLVFAASSGSTVSIGGFQPVLPYGGSSSTCVLAAFWRFVQAGDSSFTMTSPGAVIYTVVSLRGDFADGNPFQYGLFTPVVRTGGKLRVTAPTVPSGALVLTAFAQDGASGSPATISGLSAPLTTVQRGIEVTGFVSLGLGSDTASDDRPVITYEADSSGDDPACALILAFAIAPHPWTHQEFNFPLDYARGDTYVPPLTGFEVFVNVDEGEAATAEIQWKIDYYNNGWTPFLSGNSIGAAKDSASDSYLDGTWFRTTFEPVDVSAIYANKFRFSVKTISGVNRIWYTAPNPLKSLNLTATDNTGVTAIDAALLFRILAAVADEGTDFLGNSYRSGIIRSTPEILRTDQPDVRNDFWMSKPNPSKFAVEALYFDVRDRTAATVIDRILVDPVTPGVFFSVYYSNDDEPGTDTDTWDDLLWDRVPRVFQANRRENHALPYPVQAKFIKLEFTHLQAKHYAPGNFQKPVVYRKHPKWVMDYLLTVYADLIDPAQFTANRVSVVYDAINFAYTYYKEDLLQGPNDPDFVDATSRADLLSEFLAKEPSTATLADLTTLRQVSLDLQPFLSPPVRRGASDSVLSEFATSTVDTNYGTEIITRSSANVRQVSSLDRDNVALAKAQPVSYFYLTCRHRYKVLASRFEEDRAYFVGLREVAFTREDYSVPYDSPVYIEVFGDGVNLERNDFLPISQRNS